MLTQSRLVELQNTAYTFVAQYSGSAGLLLPATEVKAMIDELILQRADRVKLQGEIERLTHELAEARGAVQRGRGWAHLKDIEAVNARIDQVCDIIGERIGGLEERLEERLTELRYMFDQVETRTVSLLDAHSTDIAALKFPVASFGQPITSPTSATVGAALAQVEEPDAASEPLKPQRGDRVRLEGARSVHLSAPIDGGWYDVIGQEDTSFQISTAGCWVPWVRNDSPGLKEVRRGAALLSE